MQNAVVKLFPWAEVRYQFKDRNNTKYPEGFATILREEVQKFKSLSLTDDEQHFMSKCFPFLDPTYIDFLKGYRYDPNEVKITQDSGKLKVTIEGYWYRTILWEVPLLALISELYYKLTGQDSNSDESIVKGIDDKARVFINSEAKVADFGTRRRFSYHNQELVVRELVKYRDSCFTGTSNVYFAYKYKIKAIGTHAHEWFMHHSAKYGYKMANVIALDNWAKIYHGDLGIALSDTFTSDVFFKAFGMKHAKLFDGVRHDSGDPILFAEKTINHYISKGIDPRHKTIVFSDSLNPEKVEEICRFCKNKIRISFGIGTNLTNDVGVEPMNIVIKMTDCKPYNQEWTPVVKLSDVNGKYSGDKTQIELCKAVLRIHDNINYDI